MKHKTVINNKVTAEELNSLPDKRIIAIKNLNEPEEGICKFCGERMIWRDMHSENFNNGEPDQQDDGYWEHECDRDVLQEREKVLIDIILVDGRIKGMSSMSEHPYYPELIALQDKLYKPKEE